MSKFLISCGGTGGHLAPGIALAEALTAQGHVCRLAISQKQVDTRLLQKYKKLSFIQSHGVGFSWKPLGLIKFLFFNTYALFLAFSYMQQTKPDMVIGFGGFISFPFVLSGFALRCPIVLHESNRKPGKVIRFLSGLAQRVYLPNGVLLKGLPPAVIRHYGYPLRAEIVPIAKSRARSELGLSSEGKLIVVLGGSQGAGSLNRWCCCHMEDFIARGINLYCITGMKSSDTFPLPSMGEAGARATFVPFSDQMATVLSAADLVISRAGAGSLAELIRCRVPSIIIPYPYATDNHQEANAQFFEKQGGCLIVNEKAIDRLADEALALIDNAWLLEKMAKNIANVERFDSLKFIVRDVLMLVTDKSRRRRIRPFRRRGP